METGKLRAGKIDIRVPDKKPGPVADTPAQVRDRAITFSGADFVVNGQKMRLLSGAMHYFRIVPDYWEDRLQRLKSAGLNTVETSVDVACYDLGIISVGNHMDSSAIWE